MSISVATYDASSYGGQHPYSYASATFLSNGFNGGFVSDLSNMQQAMVRYKNDKSVNVKISSLKFYIATSVATSPNFGPYGPSVGSTAKVRLAWGNGNYQTASSTIKGTSDYVTLQPLAHYTGAANPINTDVRSIPSAKKTFKFSTPISVTPGSSVWFNIDYRNVTVGTSGAENATFVCFGLITADTEDDIVDPTITITFDSNGGSGGPDDLDYPKSEGGTIPTDKPSKSVILTYQPNATDATVTPSTKSLSLIFLGWSTTKVSSRAGTSNDVDYASGASINLKSSSTLYAVWSESSSIGSLPVYRTVGTPKIDRSENRLKYRLDTDTAWTTTENGSVEVTSDYKIWKNTNIYAKWEYRYLVDANGGYFTEVLEGSEDGYKKDEAKVQEFWKKHDYELNLPPETYNDYEGSHYTFTKLGSTAKYYVGDSSSTTRLYSLGSSVQSSENVPNDLYVYWGQETFKVRFRLGYGPEDDDGLGEKILKTVTVNYGEDVPSSQIPVPGKNNYYNNIRFWRDGPYGFQGWSGSYKNITHDSDVYALWEFCPIWILEIVNGNRTWVPYKPKEK